MTEECINGSSREEKKFILEDLSIAEVPSTKSAVLQDKLVEPLKRYNTDPHRIRLLFLDGTKSMSVEKSDIQRKI